MKKKPEDRLTLLQIKEHDWVTDHGKDPMVKQTEVVIEERGEANAFSLLELKATVQLKVK